MTAAAEKTTAPAKPDPQAVAVRSVVGDVAGRYGMEAAAFEATLRGTVVPAATTKPEFAAFLVVAREHKLNPLTREIYAFPKKGGGIQPIVSVDGWARIINEHPQFDGMEFEDEVQDGKLVSVLCKMYRKDRSRPTAIREYLSECKKNTEPWNNWPYRMLRHKAMIQCARMAFGFSGIVDEEEAERLVDLGVVSTKTAAPDRPKAGFGDEGDKTFRRGAGAEAGAPGPAAGSEEAQTAADAAQTASQPQEDGIVDAEFEEVTDTPHDPATGEVLEEVSDQVVDDADLVSDQVQDDAPVEDDAAAQANEPAADSGFPGDKKPTETASKPEGAVEEFEAAVVAAKSWADVKAALKTLSTTSAWSSMEPEGQRTIRLRIWDRVVDLREEGAKDTDPAADAQLFRIFGEVAADEEILMGTWNTLIRTDAYKNLMQEQKDGLKRFVTERRSALMSKK